MSKSSSTDQECADSPKQDNAKPLNLLATLQERLHEELKSRVGQPSSKKVLASPYITPQSSSEEVQFWLSSKGFMARTQQKFQNVKGEELFLLSKQEMENLLGTDEGPRLFNQVIIQKNFCGFKTLRSKELNSVLEARRKKIDPDEDEFSDRRFSDDSMFSAMG